MTYESSHRLLQTEAPYIEDILDKYTSLGITDLTMLALGSSHWTPPIEALNHLTEDLKQTQTHRYGGILGLPALREMIAHRLKKHGLDLTINADNVVITAGANQAFLNVALTLCDPGDEAIVLAPFYFSHKLSLQLAGANIRVCGFQKETLLPIWSDLEKMLDGKEVEGGEGDEGEGSTGVHRRNVKMLVVTNPNNPSGLVWSKHDLQRLVDMCKQRDIWLVVDQTYYEFLYDDAVHTFPSGYDRIIHIFSISKAFGMPGWRIGYIVFPISKHLHGGERIENIERGMTTKTEGEEGEGEREKGTKKRPRRDTVTNIDTSTSTSAITSTSIGDLKESFRKIQDTIPTHATILSQKLALHCIEHDTLYSQKLGLGLQQRSEGSDLGLNSGSNLDLVSGSGSGVTSWVTEKVKSLTLVRDAVKRKQWISSPVNTRYCLCLVHHLGLLVT